MSAPGKPKLQDLPDRKPVSLQQQKTPLSSASLSGSRAVGCLERGRRSRTGFLGGGSDGKEPACNADVALIPGSGRSAGGGKGCPLQCSGLESSVDRGASRASGHGLTESDTTEGVTAARGAGGSAQAPRRPPAGCGTLVGEPLGHFAQSASPRVPEMLFPTRDPKEGCLAVGGLCFPRKKACTHSGQSRDHRSIPVSLASPEAERRLPPWMW